MRTDGNHNDNLPAATALGQRFRCRSCGNTTEPGDVRIAHRQLGGGTPLLRLADSGYTVIAEDELICGQCESKDLIVATEAEG